MGGLKSMRAWRTRLLFTSILLIPMECGDSGPVEPEGGNAVVSLRLVRFAAGGGPVLVSNAVPLPQGVLRRNAVGTLSLTVEGEEQPAFFKVLHGRHRDGSVRSVLVQFEYPVAPVQGNSAALHIGAERHSSGPPEATVEDSLPDAAALPTSVDYLLETELVGPTVSAAAGAEMGAMFRDWERNFVRYADVFWERSGSGWEVGNYYDRARIYYAWWVRTGDPEYWRRGTLMAYRFREGYLAENGWGSSPRWSLLEGVALHYLLTGQERSRDAVLGVAARHADAWGPRLGDPDYEYMENRAQARVLWAHLLAWDLEGTNRDFPTLLRDELARILGTQREDGSYRFRSTCYQSWNFMMGMLNAALIDYYERFEADARIPGAVQRAVDYLWTTQWVPEAQAFRYNSGVCGTSRPDPAPDLNLMIVNGFGWLYRQTGEWSYRSHGDQVFEGGVRGAWLGGSKQFNEQYAHAFHYLNDRTARTAAAVSP